MTAPRTPPPKQSVTVTDEAARIRLRLRLLRELEAALEATRRIMEQHNANTTIR